MIKRRQELGDRDYSAGSSSVLPGCEAQRQHACVVPQVAGELWSWPGLSKFVG